MPATYEPIATTTLGSATSSITFSSIPSTYTDLRLVFMIQNSSGTDIGVRYNSDSGSNYSATFIRGNGTAAASTRVTSQTEIDLNWYGGNSSSYPSLHTIDIFSYAGSTNKTALFTRAGDYNGSGTVQAFVGLWRSTSAITSVTFTTIDATNMPVGTMATLYGILKA